MVRNWWADELLQAAWRDGVRHIELCQSDLPRQHRIEVDKRNLLELVEQISASSERKQLRVNRVWGRLMDAFPFAVGSTLVAALLTVVAVVLQRKRPSSISTEPSDVGPVQPAPPISVKPAPGRSMPPSALLSPWVLLTALLTIIVIAVFVVVYLRQASQPDVKPPIDVSPGTTGATATSGFLLWAFYFSMMLLGMVGQYMWGIKSRAQFRWAEFVRPLWVSIIVFTPFWSTVHVSGVSYGAAAAAYQNGFFWKVVLETQGRLAGRTGTNRSQTTKGVRT